MNAPSPSHYFVVDLEATCDEDRRIPPHEMETIEFGAVLVDASTLEVVEEFQTFIKPVRHPTLTPFCTRLTTITQGEVEGAPTFPSAIASVRRFLGERDALFCSWGDYDRKQLERDAARHGALLPFRGRHWNLKKSFSERLGTAKRYGMAEALKLVGLELVGTHHRGIDDARNIARLLPWITGRRPFPRGE